MRVLVFLLVIATSPVGAVVCEVACAGHAMAGHHAAAAETVVEDHHHHGDGAPRAKMLEAEAGGTDVLPCGLNSRVGNCAPPSSQPATLRTAVTPRVNALALDPVAATIHALDLARQYTGGPPVWSSPAPPPRSTIPLRI